MRALAAWVMRGRLQAAVAASVFAVAPLLWWVSGAVVALVALRRGVAEGAGTALGGLLGLSATLSLLSGQFGLVPWPLAVWMPVLVLAAWLRYSVSLGQTLRLAAGLAAAAVAVLHAILGDPAQYWRAALLEWAQDAPPEAAQAWEQMLPELVPYATSGLVLGTTVLVVASVLLARSWQATLYNPGGFAREFRALDLGQPLALAVAGLWLAAALTRQALIYDLALVTGAVFVVQALALAHSLVARQRVSSFWLVGLYVLLPLLFHVLAMVGVADAVFRWRQRLDSGAES